MELREVIAKQGMTLCLTHIWVNHTVSLTRKCKIQAKDGILFIKNSGMMPI